MQDIFTNVHGASIVSAAARNRVLDVYSVSYFARTGGLLSYGPDRVDLFRSAASYVDRILRGEKPADLPVQFPTKIPSGQMAAKPGPLLPKLRTGRLGRAMLP